MVEEGEWEIDEGFDVFGNRDVEYEGMTEAFKALSICDDDGNATNAGISRPKLKCRLKTWWW